MLQILVEIDPKGQGSQVFRQIGTVEGLVEAVAEA